MRVLVIGVGTRQGEDAAGLAVARLLARRPLPAGVSVATCERPLDLVELLDESQAVVLVDALRSGAEPGTLHRLGAEDLTRVGGLSTHAFGVAEALALARALGRAPAHLELVGIEAGPDGPGRSGVPSSGTRADPGGRMSRAVERAVAEAATQIRQRVETLGAIAPTPPCPASRRRA